MNQTGGKAPELRRLSVTIVIPTLNAAKHFVQCAKSIRRQSRPADEVIVVDAQSSDETTEIAKTFGFTLISEPCNRAVARTVGLAASSSEYVLMMDADQVLAESCIEELSKAAFGMPYASLILNETTIGDDAWRRLLADEDRVEFEIGEGLPRWFPRDIAMIFFSNVDVSAPHIHGEDRAIRNGLATSGYTVGRVYGAAIYHNEPEFKSFLQKQFRNAFYGTNGTLLELYVRVSWRSALRKFNPIAAYSVLRSPLRLVEYYALLAARLTFQVSGMILSRRSSG